jgi:hypothetical protein
MVGCDYCSGWYHYECVGLRPPNDDEDDEKVAPKDFRCPACCVKVTLCITFLDRSMDVSSVKLAWHLVTCQLMSLFHSFSIY